MDVLHVQAHPSCTEQAHGKPTLGGLCCMPCGAVPDPSHPRAHMAAAVTTWLVVPGVTDATLVNPAAVQHELVGPLENPAVQIVAEPC
jgi:hypothetical protein